MEYNLKHISNFLYVGLCKKIGFPSQLSIRRDVMEMTEKVRFITDTKQRLMLSGSRKEGFYLATSDIDFMIWWTDLKVICDLRQFEYDQSCSETFLLMECSEDRPGFALLKVLTPLYNPLLLLGCFILNDGIFISSSKFRNAGLQILCDPSLFIHGPCATRRDGNVETDFANCLASSQWPPPAMSWIDRCQRSTWPPSEVLQDILYNGCHLVPIGGKYSPLEDHEWRISFSLAEQKLVYAMNHVQFLCYGLLKLFLKEVINANVEDPPLCSYFMKTVVFWEIQERGNQTWIPDNILIRFWQCFKHIIHWVHRGECPNFFIPKYNMFHGKVVGSVQYSLMTKLHGLYRMGMSCLLHCESVKSYINNAICNPTKTINTDEMYFLEETNVDIEIYLNFLLHVGHQVSSSLIVRCIEKIETIVRPQHSRYQTLVLQISYSRVLQQLVTYFQSRCHISTMNKQLYSIDRMSSHVLKVAARFGYVSDLLYIAMYYYMTHRYSMALRYTDLAKHKLSRTYLWYVGHLNRSVYSEAVGGKPLPIKMREAVSLPIKLEYDVCYIDELKLEQKISKDNYQLALIIPPFVMVNMLTVLCHRSDTGKQLEALHDLHTLLTNDYDKKYTDDTNRDISWQILGICYQIYGDVHNAFHAYKKSLSQNPQHKIQKASHIRICCLIDMYGDHFEANTE